MRGNIRVILCFLLGAAIGRPQGADQAVLAVLRQMEQAQQTGDGPAWLALWSRESAAKMEQMARYLRPTPGAHYDVTASLVQGDQAAVLGHFSGSSFMSMRFVRQSGDWKVNDISWSENPLDSASIYALLPPPGGAFERAGSPWSNVPGGLSAADAARRGWQIRAAHDESYVYIRIESASPLPPPGSTASTPPLGWPVMKLSISGRDDLTVNGTANIGDQATFDQTGRANSHRHYVAYMMRVERARHMIFQAASDLQTSPLVQVDARAIVFRIPLRAVGIADASRANIVVGDASWPKSAIFSAAAIAYR